MFVKIAEDALENKTNFFKIHNHKVIFEGKETLTYSIHTDNSFMNEEWIGKFGILQWNKMKDFMKQLPEQPITIIITWYMHTKIHEVPEIEFRSFSKSF